MFRREEIAVGFGEADAGEVGEGGFHGGVGEVVDDGFGSQRDAGDVDEGDWTAAAEAAKECGFAGAGGAGEEEDLAGGVRRKMGKWGGGEVGRGSYAEPFGDEGAVRWRRHGRHGRGTRRRKVGEGDSGEMG